jgi:hypothetical protein
VGGVLKGGGGRGLWPPPRTRLEPEEVREMPCLFALIAVLSPRLALLLLWLFSPWVDKAFAGFFLPLLGLIFLPWTTLMYVLVDAPAGGIHFAGWFLVGLGVVLDLSSYAQSRAYRSSEFA